MLKRQDNRLYIQQQKAHSILLYCTFSNIYSLLFHCNPFNNFRNFFLETFMVITVCNQNCMYEGGTFYQRVATNKQEESLSAATRNTVILYLRQKFQESYEVYKTSEILLFNHTCSSSAPMLSIIVTR